MWIQRALPGDEGLVIEATRRFSGASGSDPSGFLGDPATLLLLSWEDEAVRGWAYGYELARSDGRCALLLYDIEVVPESRRRGHGRSLVEAFLDEAQSRGCFEVWLLADQDDAEAQRFYQALRGKDASQAMYTWSTVT